MRFSYHKLHAQVESGLYVLLSTTLMTGAMQSTVVNAADTLDIVSVTATKTERSLFDTPDTVSHVGLDKMELNQVMKFSDALKEVPGVSFGGGPRAVAEKPNIRGLGGTRILITIDGARQNFNSGHKGRVFVETELLKSVDVLRGPGSAVYGSGAMGGVIAMTTKDAGDFLEPGENFGLRVKTGFQDANNDKLGTAIAFGRFDINSGIDYVLSATRRSSEDVRLGGGDILEDSAEDTWAGLAKLNWSPGKAHRFTLSRQYTFDYGEVPAQADELTSATAVLTDRETEVIQDRLAYRYVTSNQTVDTFIYNNDQTIREKRIGTNGRLDTINFVTKGFDVRSSMRIANDKTFSRRISYGVEYYQDTMRAKRGSEASRVFPDATADFVGLYVQDEIEFTNSALGSWVLIPGLRFDDYESHTDQFIEGAANDTKESQLSPKLGLIYKATDWMNLSFSYGQSFRSPTFQELYITGVHFGANEFKPNPNLKPEYQKHGFDVGLRIKQNGVWAKGDRVRFQLSTYYNEYEDFIDTTVTPLVTISENVNEARIYGSELEASYYTPSLDVDANISLSYSVGDNLTDDQPLGTIPSNTLKLNIQKYLPDSGLAFGWRSAFYQKQDRVLPDEPVTDAYSLHDLYMNWLPFDSGVDDMQFLFGIDNIFDKLYKPRLSNLPGPGRNIKVSLIVQF